MTAAQHAACSASADPSTATRMRGAPVRPPAHGRAQPRTRRAAQPPSSRRPAAGTTALGRAADSWRVPVARQALALDQTAGLVRPRHEAGVPGPVDEQVVGGQDPGRAEPRLVLAQPVGEQGMVHELAPGTGAQPLDDQPPGAVGDQDVGDGEPVETDDGVLPGVADALDEPLRQPHRQRDDRGWPGWRSGRGGPGQPSQADAEPLGRAAVRPAEVVARPGPKRTGPLAAGRVALCEQPHADRAGAQVAHAAGGRREARRRRCEVDAADAPSTRFHSRLTPRRSRVRHVEPPAARDGPDRDHVPAPRQRLVGGRAAPRRAAATRARPALAGGHPLRRVARLRPAKTAIAIGPAFRSPRHDMTLRPDVPAWVKRP